MEHAHDADRAALARTIMRRQAKLGLRVAAVFVLILVGLPLLNLYQPSFMATRVGGFSLTWLLLAVLFYPVTWVLSWIFVRGSDGIEASIASDYRRGNLPGLTAPSAIAADIPVVPPVSQKRKLFVEDDEA